MTLPEEEVGAVAVAVVVAVAVGVHRKVALPLGQVAAVDGAVAVEVAGDVGDGVGDEHALGAVGEAGPEGELAEVVEGAGPTVAIAAGAHDAEFTDRTAIAGRYFQQISLASDKLTGDGPIGGPDAKGVFGLCIAPASCAINAICPASFRVG